MAWEGLLMGPHDKMRTTVVRIARKCVSLFSLVLDAASRIRASTRCAIRACSTILGHTTFTAR